MGFIQALDWRILYFIQDHFRSPIMDAFMGMVTKLGNMGIFWILLAFFFFCFAKTRRLGMVMFIALFCELIIGNGILKHLVARPRPCWLDPSVLLTLPVPKDYSFPSGHTFASVVSATVLLFYNKKWGICALILAGLIAFSRLYLFGHFPSDVLAGAILGIVLGLLVCNVFPFKSRTMGECFMKKEKHKNKTCDD